MSSNSRDFVIDNFGAYEQSDGSYVYVDKDGCITITWFNEAGETHREEGPAIIYACNGDMYWVLNGVNYKFARWLIELDKPDEVKMMLRLRYV
jgi:hypothetical protein